MAMRHVKGLKFLIYFVVTVIAFFIGFNYIGIEYTTPIIVAIIGFGLMIGGIGSMYSKGIFHQGHFPILMGVVFLAVGGIMFWGTLTFSWTDDFGQLQVKERWWDLTPQETGIFILLAIVGIASLISGMKQALNASYFWGNIGRR